MHRHAVRLGERCGYKLAGVARVAVGDALRAQSGAMYVDGKQHAGEIAIRLRALVVVSPVQPLNSASAVRRDVLGDYGKLYRVKRRDHWRPRAGALHSPDAINAAAVRPYHPCSRHAMPESIRLCHAAICSALECSPPENPSTMAHAV